MVQLEKTCTKRTAVPRRIPFMILVLIPTAGHMESASLKMGFSFRIPSIKSWVLDFVVVDNVLLPYLVRYTQ